MVLGGNPCKRTFSHCSFWKPFAVSFRSRNLCSWGLPLGRRGGPCRTEARPGPTGPLGLLWAMEKRSYFCCGGWMVGLWPRARACWCGWCVLPTEAVSATASRKHLRARLSNARSLNLRWVYTDECSSCVSFPTLAFRRAAVDQREVGKTFLPELCSLTEAPLLTAAFSENSVLIWAFLSLLELSKRPLPPSVCWGYSMLQLISPTGQIYF